MGSERESESEMKLCSTYAIDELKFWISQQNLVPLLSDHELQKFLHSCYYSVDDTKNTLTSFFSIRIKTSQVFLNRTAEYMKTISNLVYSTINVNFNWSQRNYSEIIKNIMCRYFVKLPELTDEGYEVIVTGLVTADSTDFNSTDYLKLYITAVETWTFKAEENSEGIIIIADAANFTFSHLRKMEFNVIKTGFQYFQDALPVRLKKIIIINVSSPVYVLLSMMQSVIAKRLVHLIEKHNSSSTKYFETVPQKMWPMEYGGDCRSVKDLNGDTIQQLKDHKEWLEGEDKKLRDIIAKQPQRQRSLFNMFF